ncbi:MAG: methyl-accepting chemotaxis protein [Thermoanaerobaculia bacterium]
MKWFLNLKTSWKLIATFLALAAAVAFVGYRGISNMRTSDEFLEKMYNTHVQSAAAAGKAATAYQHFRLVEMEMTLSVGGGNYDEFVTKLNADLATVDESLSTLPKLQITTEQLKLIDELKPDLASAKDTATKLERILADDTQTLEARKAAGFALAMDDDVRATAGRIRAALNQLVQLSDEDALLDKNEADKVIAEQSRLFQSIIIAAVIGAILIGFIIARIITTPLVGIVKAMEQVATGDLRLPELDVDRRDELGVAARTLIAMIESQRRVIGEIKLSSNQVATSADEISSSSVQIAKGAENQSSATDETSSTMVEMAAQIDQVAKSAQSLAANVDETSASIQEMGASVEQVAKNAVTLLSSVEETSATIDQMTSSIRSVATKVKTVDEASKNATRIAQEGGTELSNVINGIGTSSKDIGKIVRIIQEIADQTNLLALNAAIEAALAGDAGKGFAVVAEEVKRLAERSMNSTREISNVVGAVQRDVGQAVDLTKDVLKQIVDSISNSSVLVTEVYTAAQEQTTGAAQILKTSTNMQNVTRQLATAAKEQANGAKEIMKAVEVMNGQTQQVAAATSEQKKGGDMVVRAVEQIASVSQQNLTATEQLSKATMGLAKEAERMQRLAEQFAI